jgi:hypothetical protein
VDESQILLLVLVAAVAIIALLIWLAMRKRRSTLLRDRFGDEYDRTVKQHGRRGPAEAALQERTKRVAQLDIRALTPQERTAFTQEWAEVKAVFVDSPPEAVLHADRMVAQMMVARGYPMADFDRRYEDLSVGHGDVARHYRAGHEITLRQGRGEAGTEDLRQAMKHYEALFDHLVGDVSDTVKHRPITRQAQTQ